MFIVIIIITNKYDEVDTVTLSLLSFFYYVSRKNVLAAENSKWLLLSVTVKSTGHIILV